MPKTKLTLTIDREVVRLAKSKLALENKSISEIVERMLKTYTNWWLDTVMAELNIPHRSVNSKDVVKNRRRGLDAAKFVRELRDARAKSIS